MLESLQIGALIVTGAILLMAITMLCWLLAWIVTLLVDQRNDPKS